MYLDTDIVLSQIKGSDWLAPVVEQCTFDDPKTSTATVIEAQFVLETDWSRDRLAGVADSIRGESIELVALTTDDLTTASDLFANYPRLNVFDTVQLGAALARSEPIVSTDRVFPTISEVEVLDPRDLADQNES